MANDTKNAPPKPKAMTKAQLRSALAARTGLTAKQVGEVLENLAVVAADELKRTGVESFTLPGLLKLKLVRKAAVKGGETKINAMTKAEYVTKDKPAVNVVRARPLKGLKDSVQ